MKKKEKKKKKTKKRKKKNAYQISQLVAAQSLTTLLAEVSFKAE